jgi:hypothetical protein
MDLLGKGCGILWRDRKNQGTPDYFEESADVIFADLDG